MMCQLIKISKTWNFYLLSTINYCRMSIFIFAVQFAKNGKDRKLERTRACQIVGGVHCPHVFAVFPRGTFYASNFYHRLLLVHRNLHLLTYRRCRVPHVCRGASWEVKGRLECEKEKAKEAGQGTNKRRGKKARWGREKKEAREKFAPTHTRLRN